jgi:hypothetical protein
MYFYCTLLLYFVQRKIKNETRLNEIQKPKLKWEKQVVKSPPPPPSVYITFPTPPWIPFFFSYLYPMFSHLVLDTHSSGIFLPSSSTVPFRSIRKLGLLVAFSTSVLVAQWLHTLSKRKFRNLKPLSKICEKPLRGFAFWDKLGDKPWVIALRRAFIINNVLLSI